MKRVHGKISFTGVVDPEDCVERLCEIPGIGEWTEQYVCTRAVGQPDAFPSTDLGLPRALSLSGPKELERHAEGWRPRRAYAAMHLWESDVPIARKEEARSEPQLAASRKPPQAKIFSWPDNVL
jgi:3-methyladenine DNA glycosylase/8-oxoguanine DNA glycosylase